MEEASNGKVEETLEKVEEAVKEDVEWLVGSAKGLVKDLADGDQEGGDGKKDSTSSSSSSSDDEKEDEPVKETKSPSNMIPVEETVEVVSEAVIDEDISYEEKTKVPEVEVKEEEVTIVASSEGVEVAEVVTAEAVAEAISETTLTPEVEAEAEPAPAPVVLPVEEESKGDVAPKESEEPCPPAPEYVPTLEPIPESTGNPSIIPVSHRVLHPTSWRSCCGLFEVLRRSDR